VCPLGERRDDVVADLDELFATRVASVGRWRAGLLYLTDAWSLLGITRGPWVGASVDLRDAWRALRRTPVQTLSLWFCLALGMTMTVAMFALVNTLLTGAVPGIRDRGDMVRLVTVRSDESHGSLSNEQWRAVPPEVAGVTGIATEHYAVFDSVSVGGHAVRASGRFVNGGYFHTLGSTAAVGRLLTESDDAAGAPPVVVIGHDFWLRYLGATTDVVGRTLHVGPHVAMVVGVAAKGFPGLRPVSPSTLGSGRSDGADLWLPLSMATWGRNPMAVGTAGAAGPAVAFRLAPGASRKDVLAALTPAAATLDAVARTRPLMPPPGSTTPAVGTQRFGGFALETVTFADEGSSTLQLAGIAAAMMLAPTLVMLIAVTNVAGVQMSRGLARAGELATRAALGASRAQLVRLLGLEAAIVVIAATVTAWYATVQLFRIFDAVVPVGIVVDSRVMVFIGIVIVFATALSGVLPAWRVTRGSPLRVSRWRRGLLLAQVVLSIALLVTALHLYRGVKAMPGFLGSPRADVLVVNARVFDMDIDDVVQERLTVDLAERFRRLSGVERVEYGGELFDQTNWGGSTTRGTARRVSAGWFDATGARLLAGRIPSAIDDAVVVNETLAERLGGVFQSIGTEVTVASTRVVVAGVVSDGYEREAWRRRVPVAYRITPRPHVGATFYLTGPAAGIAGKDVAAALAAVHPQLAPRTMGTMPELVEARFAAVSHSVRALATMGLTALMLVAVGLFGATAHTVSLRLHECGVRLALGASRLQVVATIAKDVAVVCGAGLLAGVGVATLGAVGAQATLPTVSPRDPWPVALASAAVMLMAACAILPVLRRVARLSPLAVLRRE
jgi:predicted permease